MHVCMYTQENSIHTFNAVEQEGRDILKDTERKFLMVLLERKKNRKLENIFF